MPGHEPDEAVRLVTTTRQDEVPGNSGRTCSTSLALSRTMSMRLSASRVR
jgi:hypothetical protein